ncbi:hypothetical protein QBC35DRAFT_536164 [Podospora australis]|uniref:Uncharacterized protein n=1 Tax=Podospora australis TaxID=1536484 RepID=A0AAN6WJC0_9PEZI|nr:hypothetical protein QBC35DRAFT_536164 [Podospora australis]
MTPMPDGDVVRMLNEHLLYYFSTFMDEIVADQNLHTHIERVPDAYSGKENDEPDARPDKAFSIMQDDGTHAIFVVIEVKALPFTRAHCHLGRQVSARNFPVEISMRRRDRERFLGPGSLRGYISTDLIDLGGIYKQAEIEAQAGMERYKSQMKTKLKAAKLEHKQALAQAAAANLEKQQV